MGLMENISDEEITKAESCQSAEEWRLFTVEVKKARAGRYPHDWYPRVVMSGFLARIAERWNGDDKIRKSET